MDQLGISMSFCNNTKREEWPTFGYVDPCKSSRTGAPEIYFTFDLETTEIIPLPEISERQKLRAQIMIDDLQLNSYHHLKKRTQWLKAVSHAIENSSGVERENLITYISSRERELSSISRQFLYEHNLL